MKVLVTTTGRSLESDVDPRFGRAALFALVDTATNTLEAVEANASRDAMQGAGIQAARLAAELGVKVVITGHCGPKAFQALTAAGIDVFAGASGSVADAVSAYGDGQLQRLAAPDVGGHWG